MMKSRRQVVLVFMVVGLVLSSLSAVAFLTRFYPVYKGQASDFYIGRAGVSFTESAYSGKLRLSRVSDGNLPGNVPFKATQKALDTSFETFDGKVINFAVAPVYVYFKLRVPEIQSWDNGKLSIYYFDDYSTAWKKCPTSEVLESYTTEIRVYCQLRQYGLYAVGVKN